MTPCLSALYLYYKKILSGCTENSRYHKVYERFVCSRYASCCSLYICHTRAGHGSTGVIGYVDSEYDIVNNI